MTLKFPILGQLWAKADPKLVFKLVQVFYKAYVTAGSHAT